VKAKLADQLRTYGDHFVAAQDEIRIDDLASRKVAIDPTPQKDRRGWVVALAAGLGVLLLIGGIALGYRLIVGPSSDVAGRPSTVVTATAVVPAVTAPTASAAAPTTLASTTTTAATTTTMPPHEGEVPALGTGWVRQAAGNFGAVAASPELGIAAFDHEGRAWHSPDGLTWTRASGYEPAAGDPPQGIDHVAVGPAGFVAVGGSHDGNNAFYSPDGRSWELTAPSTGESAGEVVAGAPGFVIFGTGCSESAAFSPDGREWRQVPLPTGCYVVGTFWTGDRFIAASSTPDGAVNAILTSHDGETWTKSDPPGVDAIGLAGVHLAGYRDNVVMLGTAASGSPRPLAAWYSNDGGATWLEGAIDMAEDAAVGEYQTWELISTDLGYVAVGGIETLTNTAPGFVLWSHDGATWFESALDDGAFRDVAFSGGKLIGFGDGAWSWISE